MKPCIAAVDGNSQLAACSETGIALVGQLKPDKNMIGIEVATGS